MGLVAGTQSVGLGLGALEPMHTLQLDRQDTNTAPGNLLPGALSAELGPDTRLWLGSASGNRLLLSTVFGDTPVALATNGGTLKGPLVLFDDPVVDLEAATKSYVDTLVDTAPYVPIVGGVTMTGYLKLNADPTDPMHPVTKQYADREFDYILADYLALAGGTMLGSLVLAHDPSQPLEAATKRYVDSVPYLPLYGGTMTGPLILARDPVSPMEAATKNYIDARDAPATGYVYGRDNYTWQPVLPLWGGTLNGPLYADGIIQSNTGRLMSQNSYGPTVTLWNTAIGYATGMWLDNSANFCFGDMDGNGNPISYYAHFDTGGGFHAPNVTTGELNVSDWITCNAIQVAAGLFQVAPNYYLQRNPSDGYWRFVEGGTVNCTIDTGGSITARSGVYGTFLYSYGDCDAAGNMSAQGFYGNYVYSYGDVHANGWVTANGNVNAGVDMHANGNIISGNGVWAVNDTGFGFSNGASGRYFSFLSSYYWDWNAGNGTLQYVYNWGAFIIFRNDGVFINNRGACGGYGAYYNLSDESLKTNIVQARHGLAEVQRLMPVTFTRKTMDDEVHPVSELGFVAQHVQAVIPEAVREFTLAKRGTKTKRGEEFPVLAVSHDAITAALVNAVKELAFRVATLEGARA